MAGGTPAMGALRARRAVMARRGWKGARVGGLHGREPARPAGGCNGEGNRALTQTGCALHAPLTVASSRLFALVGAAGVALLLAGCAAVRDAPRLTFLCPNELRFEARLYQDMALLEGLRGHAVLERLPAADGDADGALRYADVTVRAQFGLGLDGRLVRLDYTHIPEPVYCERAAAGADEAAPPVRAHARPGPRPPPPFDPDAPVQTNIRTGDGNVGPG